MIVTLKSNCKTFMLILNIVSNYGKRYEEDNNIKYRTKYKLQLQLRLGPRLSSPERLATLRYIPFKNE